MRDASAGETDERGTVREMGEEYLIVSRWVCVGSTESERGVDVAVADVAESREDAGVVEFVVGTVGFGFTRERRVAGWRRRCRGGVWR